MCDFVRLLNRWSLFEKSNILLSVMLKKTHRHTHTLVSVPDQASPELRISTAVTGILHSDLLPNIIP